MKMHHGSNAGVSSSKNGKSTRIQYDTNSPVQISTCQRTTICKTKTRRFSTPISRPPGSKGPKIDVYHVTQDTKGKGTEEQEDDASASRKGMYSSHILNFYTNSFIVEQTTRLKPTPTTAQPKSALAKPSVKRKRPNSAPPSPERPAQKVRKSNMSRRVIEDSEDGTESNGEEEDVEEEKEGREDVRKSYAGLQVDRLADGSNKKVQ
jgi:hypothetical protein